MKKNKGFTLVELLVVIAIIGVLASILMPAVGAAFKRAKVARADTEVHGIAMAMKAYMQEYGKYPLQLNGTKDNLYSSGDYTLIMDIFRGQDVDKYGKKWNPRNILFLEIDDTSDPWDKQYKIAADWDFNNRLENIPFPGESGSDPKITVEGRNVIVWSVGNTNITTWK